MPSASSPNNGLSKRTALLPEPAKNSTLPLGSSRGVDRQDAGEERQQLPRTVSGRVGVERQHLVQSGVDPGRVVDHEGEQLPRAAQARDGDAAPGVLPGEPARYAHPPLPIRLGRSGGVKALPDPVEGLVLPDRVVDLKDHQVATTAGPFGDRNATARVLPGEPVGHINPPGPRVNRSVGSKPAADLIDPAVELRTVVDREDDQISSALTIGRRDGYGNPLVLPREPIGNIDPGRPSAPDDSVTVKAMANPKQSPVHPRWTVHHRHDEVLPAVRIQIRDRDRHALVLVREPVRDVDPRGPTTGDRTRIVEIMPDPIQTSIHPSRTVDHGDNQIVGLPARSATAIPPPWFSCENQSGTSLKVMGIAVSPVSRTMGGSAVRHAAALGKLTTRRDRRGSRYRRRRSWSRPREALGESVQKSKQPLNCGERNAQLRRERGPGPGRPSLSRPGAAAGPTRTGWRPGRWCRP